ncbi:MAG: hypothetical protein H0V98_09480 [Chloroflexia bacterium]|jgi:hypothetical protein|nr:hypothetical protein [Chloroflexia bacterium]
MIQRSLRLLPTVPDASTVSESTTLIDRYTGRDDHATCLRYVFPEQVHQSPNPGIMLVDTSMDEHVLSRLTSIDASIWHVVWVRDEAKATATIDASEGTSMWPIAPGDSIRVPSGAGLQITGGQLGVLITVPTPHAPLALASPAHGVDDFHEHNRRTTYPTLDSTATHRRKITQPLDLSRHHDNPVIVFSLAGDLAIATPTESLTLRRGEAVIAKTDRPVTIYPAGLSYVYTITW